MRAVHIHTTSVSEEQDASALETAVRAIEGVRDVAQVPSLGLLSVLYDEHVADRRRILNRVRRAGVRAYPYRRQRGPGAAGAA